MNNIHTAPPEVATVAARVRLRRLDHAARLAKEILTAREEAVSNREEMILKDLSRDRLSDYSARRYRVLIDRKHAAARRYHSLSRQRHEAWQHLQDLKGSLVERLNGVEVASDDE